MITSSSQMRRLPANLVMLVILWGYVAPAALGSMQADLPACCRGNGQHHCAMAAIANQGGGAAPIVRANSSQCPYILLGSLLNRSGLAQAEKSFSPALSAEDYLPSIASIFFVSGGGIRDSGRSPPASSL